MLIPSFPKDRVHVRQAANCVWALGSLHNKGVKVSEATKMELRMHALGHGGQKMSALGTKLPGLEVLRDSDLKDMLGGLMERMLNSSMSPVFVNAYVSLLGVVAAHSFRDLHKHAKPCEVAQLLKGMALLPRSCQQYDVVAELMRYVAKNGQLFETRELGMAAWAIAAMSDARGNNGLKGLETSGAALFTIATCCLHLKQEFQPSAIATLMWSLAACKEERHMNLVPVDLVHKMCSALAEGFEPQVRVQWDT
jgi:hypothetical protein